MKKLISSVCAGSLVLAVSAWAADSNDGQPRKWRATQKAPATQAATVRAQPPVRAVGHPGGVQLQHRSFDTPRYGSGSTQRDRNWNNHVSVPRHPDFQTPTVRHDNRTENFGRHFDVNHSGSATADRQRNFDGRSHDLEVNRQHHVTVDRERGGTINNNWRGPRFLGPPYEAFRNYHREWHDRNWWSHHCSRITFVFGGAYYWNAGYWYPAWGYNPGYNYVYDGPIYGYNNLTPDQVIVNVQEQLAREGYYTGPIDGDLGPATRQAIADFQADHGLAVTAAVDEPTLSSLGLV